MRDFLLQLPRPIKKLILMMNDSLFLLLGLYLALVLRNESFFSVTDGYPLTGLSFNHFLDVYFYLLLCVIPIFIYFELYNSVIRYINVETYKKIIYGIVIASIVWITIIRFQEYAMPRSVLIITPIISTIFLAAIRIMAVNLLRTVNLIRKKVLIHGVDEYAIQLAETLKIDNDLIPIGFISHKSKSDKIRISELPVYTEDDVLALAANKKFEILLFVMKADESVYIRKLLNNLEQYDIMIKKLPNISMIVNGKVTANDLKQIDINDLLGRDMIAPDSFLLQSCITGKQILVTGAGGSIGSELCRQIFNLSPKKLILLEQSEYFLYEIDQELSNINATNDVEIPYEAYLGSVTDEKLLNTIYSKNKINTVYHAAAHKHVPLVESNPLLALETNVLGTHLVAKKSLENKTENFVLISSDKAVRPTNVMGASKRVAEMVLQALQDEVNNKKRNEAVTKFSMVRFGNVLDTSGSVVPLFRKQISNGGPVTVTDKRIIRYFMTISEATELVIQAGSLSKGGDVFLLDMGEPISIYELAKKMIKLSGNQIKTDNNQDGIEILFTGLRPGEKLYEELLIGSNVNETSHEYIMTANEEKISYSEILSFIDKISNLSYKSSLSDIQKMLNDIVKGYKPSNKNNIININK